MESHEWQLHHGVYDGKNVILNPEFLNPKYSNPYALCTLKNTDSISFNMGI